MAEAEDPGELVVNVEHLMEYVNEEKASGNTSFKAKRYSEALAAWQRCLDACAQCDGRPMRKDDLPLVLQTRALIHSNRGQAYVSMQFWRRAITELSYAINLNALPASTLAKALWRRYKARRELAKRGEMAEWALAEADLDALFAEELQEVAGPLLKEAGLGPEQLIETREELRQKKQDAEAKAADTFEERVEEAQHKGLEGMRLRFEEVTRRNGIRGNEELASELAEMISRPGGVTAQHLAAVYSIDDDDAQVMLEWVQMAFKMRQEVGYKTMSDI